MGGHLVFLALHALALFVLANMILTPSAGPLGHAVTIYIAAAWLFICVPLHAVYAAVIDLRRRSPTPSTHVVCPACKEFVHIEASICPHCRTALVSQQRQSSRIARAFGFD